MSDDLALGRQIRAARVRQAIRQTELAAAAKAAVPVVSAIEHGRLDRVRLGALRRVGVVLGLRIDLQVIYSRGDLRHLTDEAHAALVEAVAVLLREAGWEVAVALGYSGGSIDVLGWHAASRTLLIIEVKPRLTDFQSALQQLGRYERMAPIVVRERGWEPRVTARLLVVGATRSNRRVIQSHANAVQAALPQRNLAVRQWLIRPVGRIDGLLGLPLPARAASHVSVRVRPSAGLAGPRRET
ncbi:MAG TPA: hypothetical protein VFW92_01215 [Candidatus Limnocylindrales bacterium]|nr:hypothetical protein [Candidatus Limnocylindrales bacterium]